MQLRTYTALWSVEKRLYKFYDIALPYAISVKQVGFFVGSLFPWLLIMNTIGINPSSPYGFLLWFAPPVGITYAATRPVAEGKKLFEYATSQARFWVGGRTYAALRKKPLQTTTTLTNPLWVKTR